MFTVGVIPARYGSKRLEGKALKDILGHPMVWWVYKRVCKIKKLGVVYVATDDERIEKVCKSAGIPAIMTATSHLTAANRLWEVSEKIAADFYVQINGDEPLIDTYAVEAVIPDFVPDDAFGTNVITEIKSPTELMDVSNIKVAFDCDLNALYMSRTPIPAAFKSIDFHYYKHVGIIGYNKKMLDFYNDSTPGRFETIEGIDTLRFLDYGKKLKFVYVKDCHSLSVDTEKDLELVRKRMMEEYGNGKRFEIA